MNDVHWYASTRKCSEPSPQMNSSNTSMTLLFFSPHLFHFTECRKTLSQPLCISGEAGWGALWIIKAAVLATNLTDGAHGPHVAFISWAVLGWGQQRFGVEEGFGVQGIQASIDWNLTHRTQVTVAPDLKFRGMLRWNPDAGTRGKQSYTKGNRPFSSERSRTVFLRHMANSLLICGIYWAVYSC